MGYDVTIRRNADGLERVWHDRCEWDGESGEYFWSDGNFGCDCNRGGCFARAADEPDPDYPCGETAFTIVKIVTPDGAMVYTELDDQPQTERSAEG